MPYTGSPSNNPVDAVRLQIGDVYPDMEVLSDADYQYFLDKNNGSINRASIEAARAIMFILSRWTRERTGDIEVYGSDWAKQYRQALLEFVKNPNLSIYSAMPYAGGISKSDMKSNVDNPDRNGSPFYLGMSEGTPFFELSSEKPLNDF